MAKVKWGRHVPARRHVLGFCNVPPARKVVMCCTPAQIEYLTLHTWDSGSAPCLDEVVCPRCQDGQPARLVGYAPVLLLDDVTGQYARAILCTGDPYQQIAERDQRGFRLTLHKEKRRDGTWSPLRIVERVGIAPEIQRTLNPSWFDVRERLLARYGIVEELRADTPPANLFEAAQEHKIEEASLLPFRRPAG